MKLLVEIRAYSGTLNLVELYELIERINSRVNNQISQGTGRIPILEFEKEKDSLRPLPHESVRNQYKIKTVHALEESILMNNSAYERILENLQFLKSKESLAVLDKTFDHVNRNNLSFIDGFLYFTEAQVEKKAYIVC